MDTLQSSGAWKHLRVEKQPQCNDGEAAAVTSPDAMIEKYEGQVRIFACPGGEEACPKQTFASACADGYQGVGCAICAPGYAWAQGHRCIECPENDSGYRAAWGVTLGILGFGAYYQLIAQPLFTGAEAQLSTRLSRSHSDSGCCGRIIGRIRAWAGKVIAKVREKVTLYSTLLCP